MKTLLIILYAVTSVLEVNAQCDCERIDQGNGTTYVNCSSFLKAKDSLQTARLGISGLGPDRYLHLWITFSDSAFEINSLLTIELGNQNFVSAVLVQRQLVETEGVMNAYGLFVTTEQEMMTLIDSKIESISCHLSNGSIGIYLPESRTGKLKEQIACLKE